VSKLIAWLGAVVFVASLLSFGVVYERVLSTPAPQAPGSAVPAVLFNVALFTLFAAHHSVMARRGAKAWITRIVPADLERSLYVWISSLLFLGVCWLWWPLPGMAWRADGALQAVLTGVQLAGVAITLVSAWMIDVFDLAGVRLADRAGPVVFKTTGPFGLVRHPIYLGWILIVFASPVMTASKLVFAVVSTAYLVAAIPWEEASLVATHGDRYCAYQREVRSRLLPGLW